jgi:hypothetical protein
MYGQTHSTPTVKVCCWNEQAIEGMNADLVDVWDSFVDALIIEIEGVDTVTSETFDIVREIASCIQKNESRGAKDTRAAVRTFASNLDRREHITQDAIVRATETFKDKLSSLRIDALSSVKTAFIGRLMENTYHAAIKDSGKPIIITKIIKTLTHALPRQRQRPSAQGSRNRSIQLSISV